ncbi:DinB family protein [Bacillus luteolus]|uniref:DinB family protein n=1 Tax=Litchfieldia luteola TaxID=682179 RepID=A0ABR9QH54_9BACI|nr:DinB family protein [Cytobacillus luteolus]MBE4907817.1 DinB family protein [Cytobacillus luteolus]MBP1944026.1 putative damage-inducible protein DinB [Cytobacillus luteolus]
MNRPQQGEYNPYFEGYLNLVPDGDILEVLQKEKEKTISLVRDLSDEDARFRYGPHKWSIKEVIGHIADTERIMSYRLLRIGRGDTTPLAGFNENDYVLAANFDEFTVQELLEYFQMTRNATISLVKTMSPDSLTRVGHANQSETSARAIAYIIAGHEIHHRQIINDRYLTTLGI